VVDQDDNKVKLLMDKLKNEGSYSLNKEELNKIKSDFCSSTISDELTKQTLKNVYKQHQLLIDPHTATAFKAAELNSSDGEMLILSTAHPCKFSETVHQATGVEPKVPENIKNILNKKESYVTLDNNIDVIKNHVLEMINES